MPSGGRGLVPVTTHPYDVSGWTHFGFLKFQHVCGWKNAIHLRADNAIGKVVGDMRSHMFTARRGSGSLRLNCRPPAKPSTWSGGVRGKGPSGSVLGELSSGERRLYGARFKLDVSLDRDYKPSPLTRVGGRTGLVATSYSRVVIPYGPIREVCGTPSQIHPMGESIVCQPPRVKCGTQLLGWEPVNMEGQRVATMMPDADPVEWSSSLLAHFEVRSAILIDRASKLQAVSAMPELCIAPVPEVAIYLEDGWNSEASGLGDS
ncbi:hypothetical protein HOY82DRAFT_604083 [Tuber indicum]|nr:hypothetical protein HOY82DRAFT_604083 [Tuber indicum]